MPGPLLRLAHRQPDKQANNTAKDECGTHNAGVLPDGRDNSRCTAGSSGDHIVSAFRQHRPQVRKFAPKPIGLIALLIVWIDVGIFGHRVLNSPFGLLSATKDGRVGSSGELHWGAYDLPLGP
jgi:hypothetical protein